VDTGVRLKLFEAKWTEPPGIGDRVNLDFVRNVVGKARVRRWSVAQETAFQFRMGFGRYL
jgi:hypothetical protein